MEVIEVHLIRLHRSRFLELESFNVCTKAKSSLPFVPQIAEKRTREISRPARNHREAITVSTPKARLSL